MPRLECARLLQLAVLLAAMHAGSAIVCHRSLCLDQENVTACIKNQETKLVNCSEPADNTTEATNATACIKYSVTGASYRKISGNDFSPCKSLVLKMCYQYYADAKLDLGGRLQEVMHHAGVNETVLNIHMCHTDACNAARKWRISTAALLASAVVVLALQHVYC